MAGGLRVLRRKLPLNKSGRISGVSGEHAIAAIPLVVVEIPIVDVPLPIVGVPVHIDRETGDSLICATIRAITL